MVVYYKTIIFFGFSQFILHINAYKN